MHSDVIGGRLALLNPHPPRTPTKEVYKNGRSLQSKKWKSLFPASKAPRFLTRSVLKTKSSASSRLMKSMRENDLYTPGLKIIFGAD